MLVLQGQEPARARMAATLEAKIVEGGVVARCEVKRETQSRE